MTSGRPAIIEHLPETIDAEQAEKIYRALQTALADDRPRIVFDFTQVRDFGSIGVELLLRCMEEAMKRNGDLKLAAVSPQQAVVLEMMRVDTLFEIYETVTDAVESFRRYSPQAIRAMEQERSAERRAPKNHG